MTPSTSVLQRTKHKRLSELETRACSAAFAIAAVDGAMSARALKRTLCALGLPTTAAQAQAFVYEFDFNNTATIGFDDFARIYLCQSLQRSRAQLFHDAVAALDPLGTGAIDLDDVVCRRRDHSSHNRTRNRDREHTDATSVGASAVVRCASLQHYDDADAAAVERFVASATAATSAAAAGAGAASEASAPRISHDALGTVLRIS